MQNFFNPSPDVSLHNDAQTPPKSRNPFSLIKHSGKKEIEGGRKRERERERKIKGCETKSGFEKTRISSHKFCALKNAFFSKRVCENAFLLIAPISDNAFFSFSHHYSMHNALAENVKKTYLFLKNPR